MIQLVCHKIFASFSQRVAAVWLNGNAIGRINEVALRWARLVLGWVTVSGFNFRSQKFILV